MFYNCFINRGGREVGVDAITDQLNSWWRPSCLALCQVCLQLRQLSALTIFHSQCTLHYLASLLLSPSYTSEFNKRPLQCAWPRSHMYVRRHNLDSCRMKIEGTRSYDISKIVEEGCGLKGATQCSIFYTCEVLAVLLFW